MRATWQGVDMDQVRIRVEDFERGTLPDICVATGRPADGRSEAVARTGPGWGLLLPVLGALALNVTGFVLRAARPPGSVKLRLASDNRWVEVRNAAPDFVWAYEDQLRLQPK